MKVGGFCLDSLAWIDESPFYSPSGRVEAGNFAAVGSMSPGVEIWDLDVTDSVEPVASLGGELTGAKAPKPGKKAKKGSSRKVPAAPILLHRQVAINLGCARFGSACQR